MASPDSRTELVTTGSLTRRTRIRCSVTPGAKVRMPLFMMKSAPGKPDGVAACSVFAPWKVSATSRFFQAFQYGVDPVTHRLDYDAIRQQALEVRPAVLVCGATAYPRQIDFARFGEIARECGALLMADIAHISGLVVGGAHPSPVPHADAVTTTTHKTLRGPRGGLILCKSQHAAAIDKAVFPGLQGGPHNHTTAALAVALHEAATPAFRDYAHAIVANARALADALMSEGLPVSTGGTDNHLVLFDATKLGATGKQAAKAMVLDVRGGGTADHAEVPRVRHGTRTARHSNSCRPFAAPCITSPSTRPLYSMPFAVKRISTPFMRAFSSGSVMPL